jgi:hypothetical protein
MAQFPLLKTNAVTQYPSSRSAEFSTGVLRFVDGTEQRYRQMRQPVSKWILRLSDVSEGELYDVEDFFASRQGQTGSFVFTDPWDGTEYPDCSFERGHDSDHTKQPGVTMLYYPQLATGAVACYPLTKSVVRRTVVNRMADGSAFKLTDADAFEMRWELRYSGPAMQSALRWNLSSARAKGDCEHSRSSIQPAICWLIVMISARGSGK